MVSLEPSMAVILAGMRLNSLLDHLVGVWAVIDAPPAGVHIFASYPEMN